MQATALENEISASLRAADARDSLAKAMLALDSDGETIIIAAYHRAMAESFRTRAAVMAKTRKIIA